MKSHPTYGIKFMGVFMKKFTSILLISLMLSLPFHAAGESRVYTINDAVEILKHAAGLPSEVESGTIDDAVEIMKHLVGLLNRIDVPNLDDVPIINTPRLKIGESRDLIANYDDEDGFVFRSLNPSTVTVDSAGRITAAANGGNAHILAYYEDRVRMIYSVSVSAITEALLVTNLPAAVKIGEAVALNVVLYPRSSVEPVEFSLTRGGGRNRTAEISEDGVLHGLAEGSATIRVTSGAVSEEYTVAVLPITTSLRVTGAPRSMRIGESVRLGAEIRPRNSADTTVFEVSNGNARITQDGELYAAAAGSVTVTVTSGRVSESVTVNILPITTALRVTDVPEFMTAGETFTPNVVLTPSDSVDRIEFSLSNDYARISNGVLTARSAGNVTLTVRSGSVSQNYTITIESPALNLGELMLVEGESNGTLRVSGTRRAVTWSSSNPAVATVDSNGRVTAHRAGYTCIIARIGQFEMYTDVRVINHLEKQISDLQSKYPGGYFWNSHTPSQQFPHVSETPCSHGSDNPRRCIGQCAGFAHLISNEVFGSAAPRRQVNDVSQVRQGDYVRYSNRPNHNHSVFIIRVEHEGEIIGYDRRNGAHVYAASTTWLVVHCNWWSDCGIIWYQQYNPATRVTTFNPSESYSRIP
jgi:uncharacterized protein YjdB